MNKTVRVTLLCNININYIYCLELLEANIAVNIFSSYLFISFLIASRIKRIVFIFTKQTNKHLVECNNNWRNMMHVIYVWGSLKCGQWILLRAWVEVGLICLFISVDAMIDININYQINLFKKINQFFVVTTF